jgi:hypothetical protein
MISIQTILDLLTNPLILTPITTTSGALIDHFLLSLIQVKRKKDEKTIIMQ